MPWENSSLTGQFYFNPEGAKVASLTDVGRQATISVDDSALDHAFWTSIQNSADAKSYEAYLDRFPNGTFASLARLKIDALGEQKRGIVVEATQQVSAPAAGKIVTASVAPTASDATAIAAPAKMTASKKASGRHDCSARKSL